MCLTVLSPSAGGLPLPFGTLIFEAESIKQSCLEISRGEQAEHSFETIVLFFRNHCLILSKSLGNRGV